LDGILEQTSCRSTQRCSRSDQELEQEESKLRSYLLRHPDDLVGSEYAAMVTSRAYQRVDMESLRQGGG
jgi:hypothetical protein